jgi:hypothetical protein
MRLSAHHRQSTGDLAKSAGKRVDDLDHGEEPVDQRAMTVPVVSE